MVEGPNRLLGISYEVAEPIHEGRGSLSKSPTSNTITMGFGALVYEVWRTQTSGHWAFTAPLFKISNPHILINKRTAILSYTQKKIVLVLVRRCEPSSPKRSLKCILLTECNQARRLYNYQITAIYYFWS